MTEQINDKQAVQIAEWLGFEKEKQRTHGGKEFDVWFSNSHSQWLIEKLGICDSHKIIHIAWLISPEGQEAIMDKLDSEKMETYNKNTFGDRWILIQRRDKFLMLIGEYSGKAPTRQQALLLAVLDMIKEEA